MKSMKNAALAILFLISVTYAIEPDSLRSGTGYPYNRKDLTTYSSKGAAPIISFFVPGGGHFYLGEHKTGLAYASTRLLIVPGLMLLVDSGALSILSDTENKTEAAAGFALIAVGFTSWTLDVIHAAASAKNYSDKKFQDKKSGLTYGIVPDINRKQIQVSLNYTF